MFRPVHPSPGPRRRRRDGGAPRPGHGRLRDAARAAALLVLLSLAVAPAFAHLAIIRQGPESSGGLESGDRSGSALAVGDFNGDGFDDLAIGASREGILGVGANAGAVVVVYGSREGLTHVGAIVRTAQSVGAPAAAGMEFGYALAAGDFDNDGDDDLAVGTPFATVGGMPFVGQVFVLPGSPLGLQNLLTAILSQTGAGGVNEAGDEFGAALVVGDFNGDGIDDLAVGAPGEDGDAGAVFHFSGSDGGLDVGGGGFFKQSSLGGSDTPGNRFGSALAAGNLYGSLHQDLAVGAPLRNVSGADAAGVVYLIQGSAAGLTTTNARQYNAGSVDAVQDGGFFGDALAAGQLRSGSYWSLAVGEPGRDVSGQVNTGRVTVIEGALDGLDLTQTNVLTQGGPGTTLEPDDLFGDALAVGNWDANLWDDLAVGSPGETDVGPTPSAGLVQVFFGAVAGPSNASSVKYTQTDLNDVPETGDDLGAVLAFGRFDASGRANLAAAAPGEDTSDDILYDVAGNDVEEYADAGQVFVLAPWRQAQGLTCRHAAVKDCEGDLVYSLRPFDRVRVASTTKVMTVLRACERNGVDVSFNDPVSIRQWITEPDKVNGTRWTGPNGEVLQTDQTWTLINLMRLAVTFSANDVTFQIADHLSGGANPWEGRDHDTCSEFIAEMNTRAGALGMTRTMFENPAGRPWDDPYSTAEDMAILMRTAMQNASFAPLAGTSPQNITYTDASENPSSVTFSQNYGWFTGLQGAVNALGVGLTATGIKPGSNDPSQVCAVFSASPPGGGTIVGSAFGWRRAAPATPAATRNADMAALLALGIGTCGVLASEEAGHSHALRALPAGPARAASQHTPPELITLPGVPTVGPTLTGGGAEAWVSDAESLMVEVVRQSGTGQANVGLLVSRTSEFSLGPGQVADFGIAPFETHAGFWIVNADTVPQNLLVTLSHPAAQQQVVLPAAGAVMVPAYPGNPVLPRAPRFWMTVQNLASLQVARLGVLELGYGFQVRLDFPPAGQTSFSAMLQRQRDGSDDGVRLWVRGLDANPGSEVYVSLHEPGYTVGVEQPQSRRGGPAIALAGAWPNPTRGPARLVFDLARPGTVGATVHDLGGRQVASIAPARLEPGRRSLEWDGRAGNGSHLPAGLYFCRLWLDGRTAAGAKLVVTR